MRYLNAFVATACLSMIGGASVAQAQQDGQYAPPNRAQQQNQAREPVSDQQLQLFATAMEGVLAVQEEYSQAIEDSESMEDAQTLRADAQQEMRGAVEDTGLTVEDYTMISQRLQSDPNLAQRLEEIR